MLKVYKFQKRGVVSGSLNDLGSATKCWADIVNPTKKELKDISDKAKIPLNDLKSVLDEDERPKVSDLDNYSLIIVRTPFIEEDEIQYIKKLKNLIAYK